MKSALFAFVFLSLAHTASADAYNVNAVSELSGSQLFMKASCEALAELEAPIIDGQQSNAELVSMTSTSLNRMIFNVSFAIASDKRAEIQTIVEYNCFLCPNRIHEPFVLTTEADPDVACEETP